MNQQLPELNIDGVIDIPRPHSTVRRGTHGAFRYFGKLAPEVTGRILDLALNSVQGAPGPIVDLMCGSGTTLIEAAARGRPAIGIDVNPVAILYSRAKISPIDQFRFRELVNSLSKDQLPIGSPEVELIFAQTRNAERWFNVQARAEIASMFQVIRKLPACNEQQLLLAVLLSRLRPISNASARTGRIFYDPMSAVRDPIGDVQKAARAIAAHIPTTLMPIEVFLANARTVPLATNTNPITFCHPPYFALYRFSADVLRFELELGGWDRRTIAQIEIEEGWKSGDVGKLDAHVKDMGDVFAEAFRITMPNGVFALVTGNSTLGDVQLPVVDRLVSAALNRGWLVDRHYERRMHFGSASYHKSARSDKAVSRDHVIMFRKPT